MTKYTCQVKLSVFRQVEFETEESLDGFTEIERRATDLARREWGPFDEAELEDYSVIGHLFLATNLEIETTQ